VNNTARFVIRLSAFLRKEIFEVLRQPQLLLTLVLGPFLILLFFGIGFRNEPQSLRTRFVVEGSPQLANLVEQYASDLGGQLIYSGISDLETAEQDLSAGKIDLIVVVPPDAFEVLRNNEQAIFQLYHEEVDPLKANYVVVFGRVYVDEINRRVLRFITTTGQTNAVQTQDKLVEAEEIVASLRELMEDCAEFLAEAGQAERCDRETIGQFVQDLDRRVDEINLAVGDKPNWVEEVQQGLESNPDSTGQPAGENTTDLMELINDTNELGEAGQTAEDYEARLQTLGQIEKNLAELRITLAEFLNIRPQILVSPFRSEVKNLAAVEANVTDFYAPAVIVLLLQHLIVTFAALSMVRERQLGSMELFSVSPLSALETLLGKYLSYLIFGGVLATILCTLVVYGMGVPNRGSWLAVAGAIMAVLFTSLGIGFVISLISGTDTQAVQYSMIVLLTSVFFSGFFLSLDSLWQPVRVISWSVPATYGIELLRQIMLRGTPLALRLLTQLAVIGLGLFVVAWFLLRRSMAKV
jgi:ABC-2 type transport system permease protein